MKPTDDANALLGDAGRWESLTDTQRWALQEMRTRQLHRSAFGDRVSDRSRGTRILRELEALGLIRNWNGEQDGRAAVYRLTQAGLALVKANAR